jgi:hypothetical protein
MTISPFVWYLWMAPHAIQVVILFVMLRRKLYQTFPLFFLYTAFTVLQSLALLAAFLPHRAFGAHYAYVYWGGRVVSTALRFGMIYEVLRHVFFRYPALARSSRTFFRLATVFLLALAIVAAHSAPGNIIRMLSRILYSFDRSVALLQCGLLVFLFAFTSYLNLSWRDRSFGIALGLGVFASADLTISAARLYLKMAPHFFDLPTMAAYHVSVIVWLTYMLATKRSAGSNPVTLPEHDLEIWNLELRRLIQK